MTKRRGRPLRDDEEQLWSTVKRTITPLRPEPKVLTAPTPAPEPPTRTEAAPMRVSAPAPASPAAKPALPTLHPLDRKDRQKVVRGRAGIDGRLDLHGYRQDEAHARLMGFLSHGQAMGWKLVLVITGKGRGGDFTQLHDYERGVLKRVVPLWLSLPDFRRYVLGFEDAHLTHGGSGAIYVRIRKRPGS